MIDTPYNFYFVTAGAPFHTDSFLHIPGASSFFFGHTTLYSRKSWDDFLGFTPKKYVSKEAAIAAARRACLLLLGGGKTPVGISATAAIASNYDRRGKNEVWFAICTPYHTYTKYIELPDGQRDYHAKCCSDLMKSVVSTFAKLEVEKREEHFTKEVPEFTSLEEGSIIYPGSFNPLHQGHLEVVRKAESASGRKVTFDLSTNDADKGEQPVATRLEQMFGFRNVIQTNARLIIDKMDITGDTPYCMGSDTWNRIIDPKYYENPHQALNKLKALKFYVVKRPGFDILPNMWYNEIAPVVLEGGVAISSTELRDVRK